METIKRDVASRLRQIADRLDSDDAIITNFERSMGVDDPYKHDVVIHDTIEPQSLRIEYFPKI